MPVIYLYAFVDDGSVALGGCPGYADAPLRSMTRGSVTAIFSVHQHLDVRSEPQHLRLHDKVVTTLMEMCTVAPARFGSTLADVDRLEEVLADQSPRLAPVLARLRGTAELAVRARWIDPGNHDVPIADGAPPPNMGSGRTYLHTRRRQPEDPLHSSLVPFHRRLARHAQAWTVHSTPDTSMVGAYLVAAGEVEAFRDDFVGARARHPRLRVSLTGPWAPYSFVDVETLTDA
jgi:hypothetical protein